MKIASAFLSISLIVSAGDVAAQSCSTAAGADRIAILDALRVPVAASLRTDVDFVVERARICGDWAFALTTPQLRGGGEPRWTGTPCDGDTSHLAGGLMRRDKGAWRLLDHALCPSDVAWADWPERYGAPAALFQE
jgi:hypothetical protein